MSNRFIAGVWGMVLAIAVSAAAAPGLAQAPAGRYQPYFAIKTVEMKDKFGKTQSSFYALEERDSSGRRLASRLDSPVYGGKLIQATITDPVKVQTIEINYVAQTATVRQFPPGAFDKMLPPTKPFATDDPDRSDMATKMLNGFEVKGYTWTVGDPNAIANALAGPTSTPVQPTATFSLSAYPVTHELWWSPVLDLFLLTTVRDGNGNQQIVRYDQIQTKEPTATDFSIPAKFNVRTIVVSPDGR
jgi:hypothetical protein